MTGITKQTKTIQNCAPGEIPEEILCSAEPVVIKGLVKDWKLVGEAGKSSYAAVEYLKSYYNGKPALINVGHPGIDGRYFYNDDLKSLNYDTVKAQIDEALSLILKAETDPGRPSYYISSTSIDSHFPGLREENDLEIPRKERPYPVSPPQMKIWIGTRSIATCHYDALDNIACCIAGRRRFTLFPPSQIKNLYFGPLDLTPGGQAISMVDFDNPDFEKYPRFRDALAVGQVADLDPGDAVYIPSMWMHHVESFSSFNVLVNYWWDDAPMHTGSGMNALYHGILSLRDKPEHEKEGWKQLFDYYVFGPSELAGEHLPEHARGVLGELDEIKSRQLRAMLLQKLNR